jgi:hypothetical protein
MSLDHQNPEPDAEIRATVVRLARPHPKGDVIERAAILAEGVASEAIIRWVVAHAGEPETAVASAASMGLHSARGTADRAVLRYVIPSGALS